MTSKLPSTVFTAFDTPIEYDKNNPPQFFVDAMIKAYANQKLKELLDSIPFRHIDGKDWIDRQALEDKLNEKL